MVLSQEIQDQIWEYCKLNKITAVDVFIEKMVKQGFTIEKFGTAPASFGKEPKIIEKIVEKEDYLSNIDGNSELREKIVDMQNLIDRITSEKDENLQFFKTEKIKYEEIIKGLQDNGEIKGSKKPNIYGDDEGNNTFGSNLLG